MSDNYQVIVTRYIIVCALRLIGVHVGSSLDIFTTSK